jgi:hypothetical protein
VGSALAGKCLGNCLHHRGVGGALSKARLHVSTPWHKSFI